MVGDGKSFEFRIDTEGNLYFNLITDEGKIYLEYDPATQTAFRQTADGRYQA